MRIKILNGKKAVIFDLDGTLIFTPEEVLLQRLKETFRRAKLPQQDNKAILDFYRKHKWDKTLESWSLTPSQKEEFWKTYIDYVENGESDGTQTYSDVIPTLSSLKERRIKMAVITSATPKYAQRQIEKIDENYFDYWTCVGQYCNAIPQKPSPRGIRHVLTYLGESIENSVSVGDSDLDTQMAKNAGCLDVLIDRGNFHGSIEPTIKIKSLGELV